MKSKIAQAFEKCRNEKRPALLTYTVAGDNTKLNSLKILNKISKHADILELGFPHNTPIADGGQIQGSSHRALKNGLKLKELFFYIFHGIIVCSILVVVAMITAYFLQYLGFDFIPTFLSFAPGGIHEMVVISVAYNIDPIFVSYHHFLRILIIVAFLPFLLKKFGNNSIKKDWN